MGNEKLCTDRCSCSNRPRSMNTVHLLSTFLVLLLGIVNLPCGSSVPHVASVLENGDDVPGIPMKTIQRGPTVAPVPSPETLKQLELLSRKDGDNEGFFNPAEAIRSLLSLSASSHHHRLQGLKRVSQFHGNDEASLIGTRNYRPSLPAAWEYDDDDMSQMDEDGQPTYVPFIGARALTNIPQFFEHLKENIEALKLAPPLAEDEDGGNSDRGDDDDDDDVDLHSSMDERPPKKDMSKPAARRMKTEFHVDENPEGSRTSVSSSSKQNWKPRAAGIIHYYAPKANHLQPHQSILRRANNFNPAWLYTNLGLGKRRRR